MSEQETKDVTKSNKILIAEAIKNMSETRGIPLRILIDKYYASWNLADALEMSREETMYINQLTGLISSLGVEMVQQVDVNLLIEHYSTLLIKKEQLLADLKKILQTNYVDGIKLSPQELSLLFLTSINPYQNKLDGSFNSFYTTTETSVIKALYKISNNEEEPVLTLTNLNTKFVIHQLSRIFTKEEVADFLKNLEHGLIVKKTALEKIIKLSECGKSLTSALNRELYINLSQEKPLRYLGETKCSEEIKSKKR